MLLITDLVLLGAVIVVGYLAGELIGKLKLPKVLGYLVVGMVVGPYALNLVRPDIFSTNLFELALLISIGFVGYSIGSSIHVEEIKAAGTQMTVIGLIQAFTPFVLVSLGMYLILGFDLIASLVIGAIALATAPVVALSIIQEYKTDGPLTRILMPIVALDDVLAVITFGIIAAFAGTYYSGEEMTLVDPFIEIFVSIGVGTLAGWWGYFLLKRINSSGLLILVTLLIILITMAVGIALHAELLITGIVFGLVLFNMLDEPQRALFQAANTKLIGASLIFFLVLIGGTLDITAILSLAALGMALVYIILRGGGKILGAWLGATVTKAEPPVRKYLGFTLLAAAGVSLSFAGIATTFLPDDMGSQLGIMIGAAALINEVIAVFAAQWGFKQAGEMYQASDYVDDTA
jgi:Kef-type K+ transport system membrane component KefB